MKVVLTELSKRYEYQWVVRDLTRTFQSGGIFGISGPNGSGKSTLVKMIAGYLTPSQGKVEYWHKAKPVSRDDVFQHLTMAAPYTDIINEYTAKEFFRFHRRFKPMQEDLDWEAFTEYLGLGQRHLDKRISHYSSGMNQRLQLATAILSESDLLLLDEPTSYLDADARHWYFELLEKFRGDRTIIIASNESEDFKMTEEIISLNRIL